MAQPLEDWYKNMPLITKAFMTGCLATTLAVYLDLVDPFDLYLNYKLIIYNQEVNLLNCIF
jgi:Derlin-2/3